jgi:hypothetical protein
MPVESLEVHPTRVPIEQPDGVRIHQDLCCGGGKHPTTSGHDVSSGRCCPLLRAAEDVRLAHRPLKRVSGRLKFDHRGLRLGGDLL